MSWYIRYLEEALKPFAAFADPERRVPENLQITAGSRMARSQLLMRHCYLAADTLKRKPVHPPTFRQRIAEVIRSCVLAAPTASVHVLIENTTQDILNEISSTVRGHSILSLIKHLLEVGDLHKKTLVIRSDKQTFQITSFYENDTTLTLRIDPID